MASMALKMVVVAPIPSASENKATSVKPGLLRSMRMACRRSWNRISICKPCSIHPNPEEDLLAETLLSVDRQVPGHHVPYEGRQLQFQFHPKFYCAPLRTLRRRRSSVRVDGGDLRIDTLG